MLEGYETIDSGNIVIESDGKVVATNAVEPTVLGVFDLPATDVFIVDGIKDRCLAGKVKLINADGEWYLGTFGKAHKFYVYTYAPARRYFEVVAAVAAGVLALYSGFIAVVVMVRRRADRRRLTDLLQQERDYGDKLAKAAREASSANSAKTEFLRRMSHDLRTPINGIRGMVEVGDANADDLQKQTECRSKIWTASGLLLDLANEALDMSRLESGQVDLNLVPTNLVALNREVCDILERQAEERLVTIICDQRTLVHPYARVSVTHLKRLLLNIAGNAVKYNRQGGYVRLVCREVEPTDGVPVYEYTIADNGIWHERGVPTAPLRAVLPRGAAGGRCFVGNWPGRAYRKTAGRAYGRNHELYERLGAGDDVYHPPAVREMQALRDSSGSARGCG